MKKVADKLASFVAKHGRPFEHITRQKNPGDTPFKYVFLCFWSIYSLTFLDSLFYTRTMLVLEFSWRCLLTLCILCPVSQPDFFLTRTVRTTSTMYSGCLKRKNQFHKPRILVYFTVVSIRHLCFYRPKVTTDLRSFICPYIYFRICLAKHVQGIFGSFLFIFRKNFYPTIQIYMCSVV